MNKIAPTNQLEILYPTAADRDVWNDFAAQSSHFSLMQSYEWGEFKERLGWKIVRIAIVRQEKIVACAQMLIRPLPFGVTSFAYIPRGPLFDWADKAVGSMLFEALHQEARHQRAIFLRIEPPLIHSSITHQQIQQYGFKATPQTNQPRCTIRLNIEADIDTIFANFPKNTRYQIRVCRRKGVTPRRGDESNLATFYNLMTTTGRRGQFSIHAADYYEQEFKTFAPHQRAALFLADYQNQTLGAEVPFVFGQHGAAFHGVTSNEHRKLTISDLLTWEGLKWAKEQGCRTYDLWGIPDQVGELIAANQPIPKNKKGDLWGVYYFKKGFGGEVIYYVGAYDYAYVKPMAYNGATKVISWLETSTTLTSLIDRIH